MTARETLDLREAGTPHLATVEQRRESSHPVSNVPASAKPDLANPSKGLADAA